jgi:hypothetical protein
MARFRIVASRKLSDSDFSEFDVEFESSRLNIGDKSRVFETHHPTDFTLVEIRPAESITTLVCKNKIAWDGQFVGTVADTNHPDYAKRIGYSSIELKEGLGSQGEA